MPYDSLAVNPNGMSEFHHRMREIDRVPVINYLRSLEAPCYESTLLKIAFPGTNIVSTAPLELYQKHFMLFHLLYGFQDELYQENKYLHIHFMRTFLLDYPESTACRFYEEDRAQFCQAACSFDKSYCDFHLEQTGETSLTHLSAKYFYLDAQNYYRLDEETAASFMNGTWELLAHYDDFKKSFEILGLPKHSDLDSVKKRFKHLAMIHHPDHDSESRDKFIEINNAYQFLMRMFSMFNLLQ